MTVTVYVPEKLEGPLLAQSDEVRSRQFLEAYVLQQYAAGELTSMQVGDALGLSFHQAEKFLYDHNAPPNITAEEHEADLAHLRRILGK